MSTRQPTATLIVLATNFKSAVWLQNARRMPAVGDQHKQNGAAANPFEDPHTEEKKQHISEYTAQEIATLQSRLEKQLGPEYISSRPGAAGQKVHYLAAEKVINLANEIFGFNGWSSSIQNIQIDFVDEHPETRKITLGLSVIVRVTLKDGAYHEDVGYGHIENCKGKAAAFEKAKKEGTTDGLKRALRTFGNVLGNCVYDKEYVAKVTKIKVGAGKWDEKNLHRHTDYAPKKEPEVKHSNPSTNGNDTSSGDKHHSFIDIGDFDDTEFDETDFGHPDEVVLPVDPQDSGRRNGSNFRPAAHEPMHHNITTPSRPPNGPPPGMPAPAMRSNMPNPSVPPQRIASNGVSDGRPDTTRPAAADQYASFDQNQSSSPGFPSQHFAAANGGQQTRGGFYSARAAPNIDPNNNLTAVPPNAAVQFNPHADSPSIRKTAGIDHHKSGRLLREGLQAASNLAERNDHPNPHFNPNQRIGAPTFGPAGQIPMARGPSTSAYRPPTKRGPDGTGVANPLPPVAHGGVDKVMTAAKRIPLSEVSNAQQNQHSVTARTDDGTDAKRQRMTGSGSDGNTPPQAGHENKPVSGVG